MVFKRKQARRTRLKEGELDYKHRWVVEKEIVLKEFLKTKIPSIKNTTLKNWVKHKAILINQRPSNNLSQNLFQSEKVMVLKEGASLRPLLKKGIKLLYEDKDILVVNKPPGLLSVSEDASNFHTLYHYLSAYFCASSKNNKVRLILLQRLDKDTSGVFLSAKNKSSEQFLKKNWQNFEKIYLAIAEKPHNSLLKKEGIITKKLFKEKDGFMRLAKEDEKGVMAKTAYEVLKEDDHRVFLKIRLLTGKKNQIRVHLRSMNAPVVGDKRYGFRSSNITHKKNESFKTETDFKKRKNVGQPMALHAFSMGIIHPNTKKNLVFKAPLPLALKKMGFNEKDFF